MSVKNRLLASVCAALLLLVTLVLFPPAGSRAQEDNVLRLHILADSDGEADQAVKLAVRDALLAVMAPAATAAEAEEYLLENGALLLNTAERVLRQNGCDYGAQLLLGRSCFPDRTYGGKLYPAGEYLALRVILGAGAGQNWWCLLFPPLCIVTRDAEPLPEANDIRFESTIVRWLRARRADS